jgi:hypothetical protein
MNTAYELVDILSLPRFEPTGHIKPRHQAEAEGNWLGTFNLWLYTPGIEPSIVYQKRASSKKWEPGKLDVAAGGHYVAGEIGLDGLREAKEELGFDFDRSKISFWGKKIHASLTTDGSEHKTVVWIYTAPFSGQLNDLAPNPVEVSGIYLLPVRKLLNLFDGRLKSFMAKGIDINKQPTTCAVTVDSFPFSLDNYHQHMAEHIALKTNLRV